MPVSPQPRPDDLPSRRNAGYARDAAGLLIIAVLVLVITVIRYWHHLPWSSH